jgi:hypothetical protein
VGHPHPAIDGPPQGKGAASRLNRVESSKLKVEVRIRTVENHESAASLESAMIVCSTRAVLLTASNRAI